MDVELKNLDDEKIGILPPSDSDATMLSDYPEIHTSKSLLQKYSKTRIKES